MKELNFRGLGVILPIASNDAFGLQVEQFGHSQYLESKVGLSYSKSLPIDLPSGFSLTTSTPILEKVWVLDTISPSIWEYTQS